MKLSAPNGPLLGKRFLLVAAPALCLAAAAMLLPAGLVRFATLALIGLPLLFIFLDRPAVVFYVLLLILFSNIDLFTTFRVYRVILVIGLFSFGLAALNGRRIVWHHPAMLALVAAFSLFVFQSIAVARNFDEATGLAGRYFKNLVVLALAMQFVTTRREFRLYVFVIMAGIMVSDLAPLAIAVPEHHNSLSLIWEQGVFRYEGFVLEPNAFAMLQLMLLPLLIYLAAAYRRSKTAVALLSLAMLASLGALVLSFSRGGFIGLAVLVILLFVLERRNKLAVALGVALVVAIIALSPREYWQRVYSMIGFMQGSRFDLSIYTRFESMKEAIRLGVSSPLFGIGAGNFMFASGNMLPFRLIVHNAFLQVFAEIGAVGFAVFMAIIAYNVLIIRSLMRRPDPEAAQLGRMLLLQLAAALASAFFIPVAFEYFIWFMFALPAMADYCYRAVPEGRGATPPPARAAGNTPAV